jgi:5'-3' exonuclease
LSRLNFGGLSPRLMSGMMKAKNVATLEQLFEAAKELGVGFVACEMAMHILELKKEDLIDEVQEVIGVSTFLDRSRDDFRHGKIPQRTESRPPNHRDRTSQRPPLAGSEELGGIQAGRHPGPQRD